MKKDYLTAEEFDLMNEQELDDYYDEDYFYKKYLSNSVSDNDNSIIFALQTIKENGNEKTI